MKMFQTSTILAATASLLLAASASAGVVAKTAVHSTNGKAVHSTNGNCVITKWDAKSSECTDISGTDVELRTVYFNFNGSALTPAAKAKLNALAKTLKTTGVKSVKIVGFTDAIGTKGYNQKLSERRANAVAAYLKGKGVKVKGKSEVRGLGDTESQSQCEGVTGKELKACLWRDRRVEVEIVE